MPRISFDHSPVPVIGWGRGWLVAEKPSSMSTHNDPGNDLLSRLNLFLLSSGQTAETIAYDAGFGLHAVHRLDKETSGVIVLSCRRDVFDYLSRQFSEAAVRKRYLALVHGLAPITGKDGLWQWPLTPKAAGRRDPRGCGRREPCETRYRVLEHSRHYSLITCRPTTGRTHQIRRHAALAGHPLLGDRRYGSLRACRYLEKHHRFVRLALHAHSLGLKLPESGGFKKFQSAGLPPEMVRLFEMDR